MSEMTLGKRIMQHRKRLGLTQEQLAERVGVSAQAVSKWENDLSCPDISLLPVLAEIFGVTVDELLGKEEPAKVHEAEVVGDKPERQMEYSLHLKRWEGIWFAVYILCIGGLLLLTALKPELGVSWWTVLWTTALLIGVVVPVFNVLAVISLEAFRGGRPNPRKMIVGIAKNPLIIASALGVAFNLLHVPIPAAVNKSITDLGRIATPLSLIVLGGGFAFGKMRGYGRQLAIAVSGKLVFAPLVMVSLGILAGLRNEMLVPVLVVFGSPVAVSSFTMAEQMDGDGTLAASLVVMTTALSIVTIFLFIFCLKQLGVV